MAKQRRIGMAACLLAVLLVACKSDDPKLDADDASSSSTGSVTDGSTGTGSADGSRGFPRLDGGGTAGRGRQECPVNLRPANGSACVPGRGECTIGAATCDCLDDSSKWICWEPSDCPNVVPAEASACALVGIECSIRTADAGRSGLDCSCTSAGWDCGRQLCPPAEPSAGGACESGDGVCTFGGRVCDCRSRAWVCWNASDCPASQPAAASACPVERMLCEYPQGDCECSRGAFSCEGQRTPRDGGVRRDASVPGGSLDASVSLDAG